MWKKITKINNTRVVKFIFLFLLWITISFPVYLLSFFNQFLFLKFQKKFSINEKNNNKKIIPYNKNWWVWWITNHGWKKIIFVFSIFLFLLLVWAKLDSFIIIFMIFLNLFFGILWSLKLLKKFKKNKEKKSVDDYKNQILVFLYFIFIIIIVIVLLILFFLLNKINNFKFEDFNKINFDAQLRLKLFTNQNIKDFDLFYQNLNANYSIGLIGFVLLASFLMGLTYRWLGISTFIFLFVTKTYQPLIYLLFNHLNQSWTWGNILGLIIGLVLGYALSIWIFNHKIIKDSLLKKIFAWASFIIASIANLILFGSTYFINNNLWNLTNILLTIFTTLIFSSVFVFYLYRLNYFNFKIKLKI